ncbi:MAG: protein kinase domain-containing protein [Polyangiaceae bacterium]
MNSLLSQDARLNVLRDALIGQVLPGSDGQLYPLRERIGEGGQGWAFRATWSGSFDVVVKVLRPDAASQDSLARFQREAQVLRRLSQQTSPNPHIVRFFDHAYADIRVATTGDAWTLAFTVLEYVDGPTLETLITEAQPHGLGVERARRILRHVVLAIRDVHAQNVVHRDLKPSNILIDTSTKRELAKVTDFGLAKLIDGGIYSTTALAGATVGYAPPEQFEHGNKRVGRHTDVFSLAAIFFELISGVPAVPIREGDHPLIVVRRILEEKRPSLARVMDRLPKELQERPDVVAAVDVELMRALSPDPAERHASIVELHDAIDRALSALGTAPSVPLGGPVGWVVISRGAPPKIQDAPQGGAPTLLADESMQPVPAERASHPVVAGDDSSLVSLTWRVITLPSRLGPMSAIAPSRAGDAAVAVGANGIAFWSAGTWQTLDMTYRMDPRSLRAVAWYGSGTVYAGASSSVFAVSREGAHTTWNLPKHGLVFHALVADEKGLLLAGERQGVGVIADASSTTGGTLASRVTEVPGCGPLRAVARAGNAILACGDGGALVAMREDEPIKYVRACDAPLYALLALGDGTFVAAGAAGYIMRVWPSLEARLEPIQTTKDLSALALGPDGSAWCGGKEQRVMRRTETGWVRVGGGAPGSAGVKGLWVGTTRLLAFCEDGCVLAADPSAGTTRIGGF